MLALLLSPLHIVSVWLTHHESTQVAEEELQSKAEKRRRELDTVITIVSQYKEWDALQYVAVGQRKANSN